MNKEQRQEAVFGAFDGLVSMMGVIFGALLVHSTAHEIGVISVGAAIAECISMSTGEVEKSDDPWRSRVHIALAMALASACGGLIPGLPFFIFSKSVALIVAAIGCLIVASWIGWMKHKGVKGYIRAYLVLILASGASLLAVALLPK